ncbi:versatile peroxidase VPL1 [Thozetella sp. PMI_491]|nr:versatile peroxidase VPL1 [Thozetella sp. PMI_491]
MAAATSIPQRSDGNVVSRNGGNSCPAVWTQVKSELNTAFMSGNVCNDLARASIRALFHDCGSWDVSQGLHGGCDGSLFVGTTPDVELNRPENNGLQNIAVFIKGMASKHQTSVADMIVFAGTSAVSLCPGGPKVKTFIGRADNTTSAKPGGLPDVNAAAKDLLALFVAKGYNAKDLAALLGAHTTSTQLFVDQSQKNASQDSTPGVWDVKYYAETAAFAATAVKPPGVFVFPSDQKLAVDPQVGPEFNGFIDQQGKWTSAFSNALEKMAQFGNDKNNMADCTNVLG